MTSRQKGVSDFLRECDVLINFCTPFEATCLSSLRRFLALSIGKSPSNQRYRGILDPGSMKIAGKFLYPSLSESTGPTFLLMRFASESLCIRIMQSLLGGLSPPYTRLDGTSRRRRTDVATFFVFVRQRIAKCRARTPEALAGGRLNVAGKKVTLLSRTLDPRPVRSRLVGLPTWGVNSRKISASRHPNPDGSSTCCKTIVLISKKKTGCFSYLHINIFGSEIRQGTTQPSVDVTLIQL